MHPQPLSYWQSVARQFFRHPLGVISLYIVLSFIVVGIYAPLLASSKPLVVQYQGEWFFPLFRYLFFPGFFSKQIDIFYNLLMFTFPLLILSWIGLRSLPRVRLKVIGGLIFLHFSIFLFLVFFPPRDPAVSLELNRLKQAFSLEHRKKIPFQPLTWKEELQFLNPYAQLNLLLRYQQYQKHDKRLKTHQNEYFSRAKAKGQNDPLFPSLWNLSYGRQQDRDQENLNSFVKERQMWLEEHVQQLHHEVMPLLRPFHWEDDVGGDQILNQLVEWWDLSRINRKDMVAALIFGIRISLSVGILAIGLALLIGVPVGACAGYYGGKWDLMIYRLIEIWESMPTFFMLLMIVAFLQTKSIFLIVGVIGLFGWTTFSRFTRGEFLRQKQLLYVEACHALGYSDARIIFSHLLPNALPPLLTLVPFAVMGAMTTEAGLSFLGLGEEGSNSWGVLMNEGRSAFPSESYLLWPPAILLTILLVSIALVGDSLRDALDPKLRVSE